MPVIDDQLDVLFAPYGVDPVTRNPYPPHPTQQRIRDWVNSIRAGEFKAIGGGIPVLYLQHGVDAGGTRAVLAPILEMIFESPGIRVLIGRKDFNDLRLSAMETFFEIVPPSLIRSKDEQEHRYNIVTKDGVGTIFFRELKDVKGLGSQEFAVIVVHEAHEIDLMAYRTLKLRCRQAGYPVMLLMEGNPPVQTHWLEDLTNPASVNFDSDITKVILPSYENWNFMNESYKKSLESMPASWRKRYVLGETSSLPAGTPVYPSFTETVHVKETQIISDRPIIRSWDFGFRRAACLWSQYDDSGKLQVHREWMALETPEEQFIDGVIMRTNQWFGSRVCRDYGDPAARNRDPHGVSTLERLTKRGVSMLYRPTTYAQRIPLVNKKLSEMVNGLPAISFNPACQILIEGLSGGYHYPELKEGQELSVKRDQPFHDQWFSHTANAFEYLIVNLFGFSSEKAQQIRQAHQIKEIRERRKQGVAVF